MGLKHWWLEHRRKQYLQQIDTKHRNSRPEVVSANHRTPNYNEVSLSETSDSEASAPNLQDALTS
ncbi:MAG: hypothetical protein AAF708_23030, partial [Deinococcota bacterium]